VGGGGGGTQGSGEGKFTAGVAEDKITGKKIRNCLPKTDFVTGQIEKKVVSGTLVRLSLDRKYSYGARMVGGWGTKKKGGGKATPAMRRKGS